MPGLRDSGYSTNGCAQDTGRQGIGREPEGVLMRPKAVWVSVYSGFDLAIYYKTRLANSISSTMQCGTPARLHTTSAATRGIDSRAINLFIHKPLTEVPLTPVYERAAKLVSTKCSRSKGRVQPGRSVKLCMPEAISFIHFAEPGLSAARHPVAPSRSRPQA